MPLNTLLTINDATRQLYYKLAAYGKVSLQGMRKKSKLKIMNRDQSFTILVSSIDETKIKEILEAAESLAWKVENHMPLIHDNKNCVLILLRLR